VAQATRTLNPLPFQDLEPRRFEDLVRQLAYDFKPWRRLEATGRSGGDGSFDARGYEIVPGAEREATDRDDENNDTEMAAAQSDRLWLIQCKRERAIGPAKLKQYLDEIPVETRSELHGMIFAAACDFSKATRDILRGWAREHGINEAYMWGKGELEDQLYQPKNDNLLFAYFGISLQIRKRSVRTALRARLSMKKRAETVFSKTYHNTILLRDPTDDRYPHADDAHHEPRWRVVNFGRLHAEGISFEHVRHFAAMNEDYSGWDIIDTVVVGELDQSIGRMAAPAKRDPEEQEQYWRAQHCWSSMPDHLRGNYYERLIIRYEDILAIDEVGDEYAEFPHVYFDWDKKLDIVQAIEPLVTVAGPFWPDPANRITIFPMPLPEMPRDAAIPI
jgi:hypothetical protein